MSSDVAVADVPERERYEARLDGGLAGFILYRDDAAVRVLTHTEVASRFEGRGVGGSLVRGALDDARERGLRIRPQCPFVRTWLGNHADYLDVVVEDQREALRRQD